MKPDPTAEVLRRFNAVFLNRDPAPLAVLVDEHCVIDRARPAADGSRIVGRDACVALWTEIATMPDSYFVLEDVMVMGDTGIILWRLHRKSDETRPARGLNLMRVREGCIVEASGYLKGT
jgi:hypothetical protein